MMLDGFSYAEIAAPLGISESHVGVKLNRLKQHLSNLSKEGTDHEI
jgi:RNA polymerase sigma-70 factor, ECF subfamily